MHAAQLPWVVESHLPTPRASHTHGPLRPSSRVAASGMTGVARALSQESEDDEIVRKTTLREVKVDRKSVV